MSVSASQQALCRVSSRRALRRTNCVLIHQLYSLLRGEHKAVVGEVHKSLLHIKVARELLPAHLQGVCHKGFALQTFRQVVTSSKHCSRTPARALLQGVWALDVGAGCHRINILHLHARS